MSNKPWKAMERQVAAFVGGRRYWTNAGQAVDVESGAFVVQVKHVKTCSLAQLEALAVEAERQGTQRTKIGLVVTKRRAGKGLRTTTLVIMTVAAFRAMSGPLPGTEEA